MRRLILIFVAVVAVMTFGAGILGAKTPKCKRNCDVEVTDPTTIVGDGGRKDDRIQTDGKKLTWKVRHLPQSSLVVELRNFNLLPNTLPIPAPPACPGTFTINGQKSLPAKPYDSCGARLEFNADGARQLVVEFDAAKGSDGQVYKFDIGVGTGSGSPPTLIDPELEIDTSSMSLVVLVGGILAAIAAGVIGFFTWRRFRS